MRILSGAAAVARVHKIAARASRYSEVEPAVKRIIADVRDRGDRALLKHAERWDGLRPRMPLRVSEEAMRTAWRSARLDLKRALRAAAANIWSFCEMQKPVAWTRSRRGISVGQLVRPLNSVGCYVPGGRYPLISTLLMTVIPAQVAGVENIRVVSPQPQADVLAAAAMLGIRELYCVGGAQAIAALAYGTESIPRVDKIVGPGNLYVTSAKKLVVFDCSIDFLAGPTEILVVSDTGSPELIAADLVAQAEHDPEALAVFITTRRDLASRVASSVSEFSRENAVALQSLRRNGVILVATSRRQSFDWANQIAPEHLTIDGNDLALVQNAGSVFIGDYSAQAAGDYASGPNHVLPTGQAARFRGGLSVLDFVKLISIQKLSKPGLKRIAPVVELLADAEGLCAHADSIRRRIPDARCS
ncbi:MAG TPA: histidinol dehydrogenase [Candidatus Eremiobacteraceae bacterium]|nr:histidinol dehydrogenase [Candidatus Eremiobacteraceae bacterium]